MPVFYYRMKHTLLAFVARNFTGCAYCNEKKLWKMFGEKCVPLDNFNTLIDSVPVGDDETKYACYFFPKQHRIEINRVDENGKYITLESVFVHNCPECGRPLPYMLDSKKKKEKVVIASTPKGPNVFYDMWKKVTGTR